MYIHTSCCWHAWCGGHFAFCLYGLVRVLGMIFLVCRYCMYAYRYMYMYTHRYRCRYGGHFTVHCVTEIGAVVTDIVLPISMGETGVHGCVFGLEGSGFFLCTIHFTLHSAYCILRIVYCTLHTAYCMVCSVFAGVSVV